MSGPRLWEADHPYYCTEGNYYASPLEGLHEVFESWADFIDAWGDTDQDMNLVFRWDWTRTDPDDYDEDEDVPEGDRLFVYWVLQRKAILRSTECTVTEDDEPAVREWLTKRAATITAIWEPISLAEVAS